MGKQYTDKQLKKFNDLTNDLIIWMFHRPDDSFPIVDTIKKAFEFGLSQKQGSEK